MNLKVKWIDLPVVRRRFYLYTLAAVLVFLLLLLRLWYLQVISYEELFDRSVRNRTRMLITEAPRGPVYDRHGVLLVDNRPAFQISVMRQDIVQRDLLFERLSGLLDVSVEQLEMRWQEGRRLPVYRPVPLMVDVDRELIERVQENSIDLPGVLIEVRPIRDYPEPDAVAHVIGYLGEITEKELKATRTGESRGGDLVGKVALERAYEDNLRGSKGQQLIEVDVQGRLLRMLQAEAPEPGKKIHLTVDLELQKATVKAFGERAGSAVALNVHSGEVLAMVSLPTYNPAMFARGINPDEWRALLADRRNPLQNKAITGLYPPASTFKMIVALAALRDGIATPDRVIQCDGDLVVGDSRFRCWKRQGHGLTDLKKALRESCDVWFYQVGLELGIDKLSVAAKEFGFGSSLGFSLPGERAGTMPSREWKHRQINEPWYAGETVIAAIGQGYVLTTPLQLAVMTAALANGGKVLKPQIVNRIEDWNDHSTHLLEPELIRQLDYSPAHLQTVNEGMFAVVNEPRGTGRLAQLEEVLVAGKTGTSQVVRRLSDEEEELLTGDEHIPYRRRSHGLFVAYAPAENPEIAVAVVVEHGQSGGAVAAPIAREIISRYFQNRGE
ncbi:MAG: penicillin-binding protein 2 [Pelovirga sp.]